MTVVAQEGTLAGADSKQEMCNLFMMVWSENPYFMVSPRSMISVVLPAHPEQLIGVLETQSM